MVSGFDRGSLVHISYRSEDRLVRLASLRAGQEGRERGVKGAGGRGGAPSERLAQRRAPGCLSRCEAALHSSRQQASHLILSLQAGARARPSRWRRSSLRPT